MNSRVSPFALSSWSPSPWLILGFFLALTALAGGGARSDIASLPALRSLSVCFLFLTLATATKGYWREIRTPLFLLLVLALWMAVQLVPLSVNIWSGLPDRDLVLQMDKLIGEGDRWRPISMTPLLTINSLLALILPLTALLVAAATPANQRIRLWWAIWAFGVASVGLGLLQFAAGEGSVFYLYRITNVGSLVGLFSNRNHNALLLCLAILSAGWLLANELRRKKRHMLLVPTLAGSIILFLLMILVIGSRLGLVCGLASLVVAFVVIRYGYGNRPKAINQAPISRPRASAKNNVARRLLSLAPVVVIVVVGGLFYLSDRANAISRLVNGDGVEEIRLAAFGTVAELAERQWILGSGFGSFASMFQVAEPDALLRPSYFNHAHNDWLQLPIEGGLPAVLIALLAIIWVSSLLIANIRARSKTSGMSLMETVTLTAAFGCFALGSVVDYPLRTPSLMVVAAFLVVLLARCRAEAIGAPSGSKAASLS